MEARIRWAALGAVVLLVSMGAQQRSANFIVETPDPGFARQVSQAAEQYRHDLAIEWLGQAMPNWSQPCVMTVQVGPHLGAGGADHLRFRPRRGLRLADDDPGVRPSGSSIRSCRTKSPT